jgi:uncharacterized protein YjlB
MMPEIISQIIEDDGTFPGNPLLGLRIYPAALDRPDDMMFEGLFFSNAWPPAWVFTIYDFHHYHSTAHEALGCFKGEASIQFGGPDGPVFKVRTGDAVMIPAGVAHCLLKSSGGFTVVGAYPAGTSPDLKLGKTGERPGADENIAALHLPQVDPVTGKPVKLRRAD